MDNEVKIFEGNQIRSLWDNEKEEWYSLLEKAKAKIEKGGK